MEKAYNVYEQRPPVKFGDGFVPNLVKLGRVYAENTGKAIDEARTRFMIRWPVVAECDIRGNEIR